MTPPTALVSTSDPGFSRFAKQVDGLSFSGGLMYGTHVCDVYRARPALEEQKLRPRLCPKFNEELLYLFYLKPSFRPSSSATGKRFGPFFPVCFVVKLDNTIAWKRVFPFDSGAFPSRYVEFLHDKMQIEDFLMPPRCESAAKIVTAFYESDGAYYDAHPLARIRAGVTMETEAYHKIAQAFGSGQNIGGDDRLVAVEMQATSEIPITPERIAKIIVPDKALVYDDITAALEKCGVEIEHYSTGRLAPHECYAYIDQSVRKMNGLA